MNTDKALELARLAYPNDENLRVAYMLGLNAGAEWQYQKDRGEFAKIKAKTWCEGFDAHKEQMLKDAVEADVNTYIDLAAGKSWAEFVVRMPTENLGDKVHLIIIKEDK